ncbi:GIY-YIG nuclease family protein [Puniceicoccales bacterium CK1056]|uniref:GIY-YIG nuclease family protein n=1 Tax=Oceanipulchritudo coccoides TaxID=2706888 RepID=A0A6B2M3L2_9BACT|nr:GIY-YIG nuclease family protein [Oceanipulchritudo coccoides]NDV62892.1 GIY-YIG nuclease family protein [Oceanipulchritudo coccoides]
MLKAHEDTIPRIHYDLEEIESLRSYRDRLIVQWRNPRGWHQWKDLDIYEILPVTVSTLFPGYQEVSLSYEQLRSIFADPRAHRDWKAALKANAGIYRIVDMSTGETYIGSAYGSDGLWGRWGTYAKTGHGGNKLLKERKPGNFRWSIVRTLSTTMAPRDVIQIESMEKIKHGSRAIGLNEN